MDTMEIASMATEALTRARQAGKVAEDALRALRCHDPILQDHDWRLRGLEAASRQATDGHGVLARQMAIMEASLGQRLAAIEGQWEFLVTRTKQALWMIGILAVLLPRDQWAVLIANAVRLLAGGN